MSEMKQLSTAQLEAFDTEYVRGAGWDAVTTAIDRDFPSDEFTFMDIGGGNGVFTDRILERYPRSRALLLDNAAGLLSINKPHPRKTIIDDTAANLASHLSDNTVDLVFINWVLHHLVSPTWRGTRGNVTTLLGALASDANVRRVCVFENSYNGLVFNNLPGRLIFESTSLKWLSGFTRRMGANTAGVGVAFRSRRAWERLFDCVFRPGSTVATDFEPWPNPLLHRLFLHSGRVHVTMFWITVKR
ncbi:MAG: class I SAM-dependent methyltransferase [Alistipes sp.]|jgi:hypothetical protein|nr:class I SAM-dependent methyltransferase [Alistipes sp.]